MKLSWPFITGYVVAMLVLSTEVSARSRANRSGRRRQNKSYASMVKIHGKRGKNNHQRILAQRPARCPKKLENKRWAKILNGYYSEEYWNDHWNDQFGPYPQQEYYWVQDCIDYWEAVTPTAAPNTSSPTGNIPTLLPSKEPSRPPTSAPTISPTNAPSTPSPTKARRTWKNKPNPATTSSPTLSAIQSADEGKDESQGFGIQSFDYDRQMEQSEIKFTYINYGGRNRKLSEINIATNDLLDALLTILNAEFRQRLQYYKSVRLWISNANVVDSADGSRTFISFVFGGDCTFNAEDPTLIPNGQSLMKATLRAFSANDAKQLLRNVSNKEFSTFQVTKIGSDDSVIHENPLNVSEVDNTQSIVNGNSITIASCVIAVCSTMAALGLIYMQRRKMNEVGGTESPTKSAKDETSPKSGGLRLRSPFPISSTPADGTKRYFCRLDDESIASKSQTNGPYMNPNVSCVNSSFSRDEESSLEAPSMSGLSSINEQSKIDVASVGGESLANMSALDEVRLAKVLDLGPDTDNFSLASTVEDSITKRERRSTFSKLWYGGKKKNEATPSPASNDDVALPTSSKDSSSKKSIHSPLRLFPVKMKKGEPEAESLTGKEKEVVDDVSLLGDQSNKGEYYAQNDESNLFYNMLGGRSVNSYESDSVDFNDMYNGVDGSSFEDGSSMGASSRLSSAH